MLYKIAVVTTMQTCCKRVRFLQGVDRKCNFYHFYCILISHKQRYNLTRSTALLQWHEIALKCLRCKAFTKSFIFCLKRLKNYVLGGKSENM